MNEIKTSRRQFLAQRGQIWMLPVVGADLVECGAGGLQVAIGKLTQACANCKLVQGADADAWRPCSIFPGKTVNAKGWCAAYAAKA